MKKQVIRLTESDLHKIIRESVKKIVKEMEDPYSLDADEIYGDRAAREDSFNQKMQMMRDEWERKNIAIRKKYPGKSNEWYEAMLDTFYESKTPRRTIKEAHGEPDERMALIYDGIIEAYKAQEIADEYNMYSEDEAAAEWFKGVVEDGNFEMGKMPLRREFIMNIPELDAEMYYDYGAGYYFLVKKQNS